MSAPSTDIRDILVSELGLTWATDLFRNEQPPEPDICTTLYDVGGIQEPDLGDGGTNNPRVMIRVRHLDYTDGYAFCQSIVDLFKKRSNFEQGGSFYLATRVANGPNYLDLDHKKRIEFSINLEILRRI